MGATCEGQLNEVEAQLFIEHNYEEDNPCYQPTPQNQELINNLKKIIKDGCAPQYNYAVRVTRQPIINDQIKNTRQQLLRTPLKASHLKGTRLPTYKLMKYPDIFYLGEWAEQKPHGKGKILSREYYIQAYFSRGQLTCQDGIKIWSNGSYYRGEFNKFYFSAKGKYYNQEEQSLYEGEWKMNRPHGVGTENIANGELIYHGLFHEGKRHGKGEVKCKDGYMYVGQFRKGKKQGEGTQTNGNNRFKGSFYEDRRVAGELFTPQFVYCGRFINSLFEDPQGYCRSRKDNIVYIGPFREGKRHGKARVTLQNGQVMDTLWQNDEIIKIL